MRHQILMLEGATDPAPASLSARWTKLLVQFLKRQLQEIANVQSSGFASQVEPRVSQLVATAANGWRRIRSPRHTASPGDWGPRSQARWKYGVQLLHWQYNEGLLDSVELLGWLATEFRCGRPITG